MFCLGPIGGSESDSSLQLPASLSIAYELRRLVGEQPQKPVSNYQSYMHLLKTRQNGKIISSFFGLNAIQKGNMIVFYLLFYFFAELRMG